MPHTHYTTLISAANLAERLAAAPGSVALFDCRFDLVDPAAGEAAYAAGHIPGAQYLHLDRDLSGRKTAPTAAIRCRPATHSPRCSRAAASQGQQVVAYDAQGLCGAPVVVAALAWARFGCRARRRPAGLGSGRPAADGRRTAPASR